MENNYNVFCICAKVSSTKQTKAIDKNNHMKSLFINNKRFPTERLMYALFHYKLLCVNDNKKMSHNILKIATLVQLVQINKNGHTG